MTSLTLVKMNQIYFYMILGPSADFHKLEDYIDIDFEKLLPGNANATMSKIWADAIAHPIPPNKESRLYFQ